MVFSSLVDLPLESTRGQLFTRCYLDKKKETEFCGTTEKRPLLSKNRYKLEQLAHHVSTNIVHESFSLVSLSIFNVSRGSQRKEPSFSCENSPSPYPPPAPPPRCLTPTTTPGAEGKKAKCVFDLLARRAWLCLFCSFDSWPHRKGKQVLSPYNALVVINRGEERTVFKHDGLGVAYSSIIRERSVEHLSGYNRSVLSRPAVATW